MAFECVLPFNWTVLLSAFSLCAAFDSSYELLAILGYQGKGDDR